MKLSLKPLKDQTVVITGASSGIGRATAREAARRGAHLVLASRNKEALEELTEELKSDGAQAVSVVADVGNPDDHEKIVQAAMLAFGGFETWVNNAGVSIFGKLEDVAMEDQRQLFETNYWGVVYGSMAALKELRARGGALINLGSELSDVAIPLQGAYCASKHAVKGFTDSLRMELEIEEAPVSVTLIKPGSIDTGFVQHAKNYLDVEPKLPPPVYSPQAVAEAILYAAEHPMRDIYVGGAARATAAFGQTLPGVADRVLGPKMHRAQRSRQPAEERQDALWHSGEPVEGGRSRHVCASSLYTDFSTRWRNVACAGLGAAAALVFLSHCLPKASRRK
ncbi:MAG TPA: SDR family oxidoreductase [Burkholderiaceae bacterium]|nr:SDR family oxidoreductase [Burkholderiaceae bacterium]